MTKQQMQQSIKRLQVLEVKAEISKLNNGEKFTVDSHDGWSTEFWKIHDRIIVFEIPQGGSTPLYEVTLRDDELESEINLSLP